MSELEYISPEQEYVYRVVDSEGRPIKTRISGSGRDGKPSYTIRTYKSAAAAWGVATRRNNELNKDEYEIQVSEVHWRKYDPATLQIGEAV